MFHSIVEVKRQPKVLPVNVIENIFIETRKINENKTKNANAIRAQADTILNTHKSVKEKDRWPFVSLFLSLWLARV